MLKTIAGHIIDYIERRGIDTVFGIPGSHNVELFDALRTSGMKTILTTSELSASFMAEAYGKITGKPAALVIVPGPGLTYASTGIAGACLDSTPMLVIIGGYGNNDEGKCFHIHGLPQEEIASHLAKAYFRIDSADETEEILCRAMNEIYYQEPGPVVVEVPVNIQRESGSIRKARGEERKTVLDSNRQIDEAVRLISGAKRLCIYAGQGGFGAGELIRELAEKFSAPVATTISGRGVIPEDHPLCAGYGFGPTGETAARKAFAECDVLVSIGCKFSEMTTGGWNLDVPPVHVRIDVSRESVEANFSGSVNIVMDAKEALEQLLDRIELPDDLEIKDRGSRIEKMLTGKTGQADTSDSGRISPEFFYTALRNVLPRDGILCCDCGMHQMFAFSHYPVYEPRTFINTVDYQSMGFGVPAAIAAKRVFPERAVMAVVGDGGFLMTGMELINAARDNLSPVIFVFRDNGLGLIEGLQKHVYQRTFAVKLRNPDYKSLAESFGVSYALLADQGSLEDQLRDITGRDKPVLAEVAIHYTNLPHYCVEKMKTSARALPLNEKILMGGRLLARKLFGGLVENGQNN